MKTLIKYSLFTFISFTLIACNESSNSEDKVTIWSDSLSPVHDNNTNKPNAFFNALKRSEAKLRRNYNFRINHAQNGSVTYRDLSNQDFRRIASQKNTSTQIIRAQFLEDVYHFALNYELLLSQEDSLRKVNNDLYNSFISKTFHLGQAFSIKRINHYNLRIQNLESKLRLAGIELTPVLSYEHMEINLPTINNRTLRQVNRRNLSVQIQESKMVCNALHSIKSYKGVFTANNIDYELCAPETNVIYFLALLDVSSQNKNNFNIRNFSQKIKSYTNSKVNGLHVEANKLLLANGIILSNNSPAGINDIKRQDWEGLVRFNYSGNISHQIMNAAIKNNLYENLDFKRTLVRLSLNNDVTQSQGERELHRKVLRNINKALSSVRYNSNIDFVVGTSPGDGFFFIY